MANRSRKAALIILCIALTFVVGAITFAQSGDTYRIKLSSIDGGVSSYPANPAYAPYRLRGTIGQPEGSLSTLSGGSYTLQGGVTKLPVPIILPPSGAAVSPNRNYFTDSTVTFSWTRVTYAMGYWVQVARDNKFNQIVFEKNDLSNEQLSQIVLLPGNGTYYWRVRAKLNPVTWAVNWSATVQLVVGPEQPISTPTSVGMVCPSLAFTCPQLFTCQEAYACLAAGNFSLDPDNDGIPCEDAPLMCS